MATLTEIREGLAANLEAIGGCQVSAYMAEAPLTPGLYVIGPDAIDYDLAMHRGLDHWTIVIQGFTGPSSDRGKQMILDEWLAPSGSSSVKAAVESDQTLGGALTGVIGGVRVARVEAYRDYQLTNGTVLFGAAWFVDVFSPA